MTASNINYTVGRCFDLQWKSIQARKKEIEGIAPKITRNLMKWIPANMTDFLGTIIGVRDVPISYVGRTNVAVPDTSDLLANKPYSEEHGSIETELIARVSHDHPLFGDDSAKVFNFLEEATRGTAVALTIAPYKRKKDGGGCTLRNCVSACWIGRVARNHQNSRRLYEELQVGLHPREAL